MPQFEKKNITHKTWLSETYISLKNKNIWTIKYKTKSNKTEL